ncbi:MAG: nucleotidyltransferase domain-containing protein [Ktedonobacterales bacterium]
MTTPPPDANATEDIAYAGNQHHQRVLRAIVGIYAADARVRVISLFGSLARGNWDDASDLDLDVVIADGVEIEPVAELTALCAKLSALGERAAVLVRKGADRGDVVLASLLEFSIRYHPLATTSPNIVESLRLLWRRDEGAVTISDELLRAAGRANSEPSATDVERALTLDTLVGECVRQVVGTQTALTRRRYWFAVEALHMLRSLLMEAFTLTHGGERDLHTYQALADPVLQAQLAQTLPIPTLDDFASVRQALLVALAVLERDLPAYTANRRALTAGEREVVRQIRHRQQ